MTQWITLSREKHASLNYLPRQDYRFTANHAVVPILAGELQYAVTQFVMGFIERDGQFQLDALLGKNTHSHHYIHPTDGRWLGSYVPALFRGHPFRLAKNESTEEMILQIHEEHLSSHEGNVLFDAAGGLDETASKQMKFLGECASNRQQTDAASQKLADAGVLKPWQVDKQGQGVRGLYQVDEKSLNSLSQESFFQLSGSAMAMAYGQLFSMSQHDQLAQRAELHTKLNPSDSIDELFNDDGDDIQFNFE